MFEQPISHATDLYSVEKLAFDVSSHHFVGLILNHIVQMKEENMFTLPYDYLNVVPLPEELKDARDTRLVGIRSTSECNEAKTISSLQLIYFSINQSMCDDVLMPITSEMTTEPSAHGPTCEEGYFETT